MLKVRYFGLRLSSPASALEILDSVLKAREADISILSSSSNDLVLLYRESRRVKTSAFLDDGTMVFHEHSTFDFHRVRLMQQADQRLILSIIDPPRGSQSIAMLLKLIFPDTQVFFEPLTFGKLEIEKHIRQFDSAKLVSAKIKNFHVYDNAVGRLEISAKTGLSDEIAPFLEDKYYEIDSLTYEVIADLTKGLITYSANGTVKVSNPMVEKAFSKLEACL